MKRMNLALIVGGVALAGNASAQSSVTLYGIVDANVRYISYAGHGSAVTMGSFGNAPSSFGLVGSEDLGGGLKAEFRIEAALVPSTGQSATQAFGMPFFNRASWIGLTGSFGTVHLGRDWSPTYNNLWPYDPTSNLGIGNLMHLSNLVSQAIVPNYYWNSNSITYYLPPDLGGLFGSLQTAVRGDGLGCSGDVACTTTIGSYIGGRLGYKYGPIEVAMAIGQTGITDNQRLTTPSGKWTQANLGFLYNFNVLKLTLSLNTEKFINIRENRGTLGLTVPIGVDEAWASAGATKTDSAAQSAGVFGAHAFAIGYVHNLSKRTAVYGSAAYLKNSGSGTLSVEDVGSYSTNTLPGRSTTGVEFGIRTIF
jgi:predicted porin